MSNIVKTIFNQSKIKFIPKQLLHFLSVKYKVYRKDDWTKLTIMMFSPSLENSY